jgi:hypothetical protein
MLALPIVATSAARGLRPGVFQLLLLGIISGCCLSIAGESLDGGDAGGAASADSGPSCPFEPSSCTSAGDCPNNTTCVTFLHGSGSYGSGFQIVDAGMGCCALPSDSCACAGCCSPGGCSQNVTCYAAPSDILGALCENDEGCGTGLSCRRADFSGSSGLDCCFNNGQPVDDAGFEALKGPDECCSGYLGTDGRCACVPAGVPCTRWTDDGGCCSGRCNPYTGNCK